MKPVEVAGFAGFFIACVVVLSGCSSSGGDGDGDASSASQTASPSGTTDASTVSAGNGDPAVTDGQPTPEQTPGMVGDDANSAPGALDAANPAPADDSSNPPTATPTATGSDASGGDDDSPTATESLSLVGPFIKDTSRSAGPPSTPQGLTLLLSGENWMEFTWAPSTDDQSVEAYEIFRDGEMIFTVRGDTDYEFDYRSWISTSYMDCNYTRYASCQTTQPAPGSSHEYFVIAVDNEGMRSQPSEPAVFSLQTLQNTPVDLTGYEVVFNEEFTGDGLDRDLWKTALPWGEDTTINGEMQYFVNVFGSDPIDYDPFVFTGDTLQITGIPTPANLLEDANGLPYLSGVLTTADHFEMTYGYVEMSARVAGGEGLLSTFYLFNQDFEKNKPEIDILEYIGSRPDKTYQTYHYYDSNRARYATGEKHSSPTMETATNIDLSADFHTYGVLWEPGLVVWTIDGVEVRRMAGTRVSDEPMNIIAQLVIGSAWIGEPDPSLFPTSLEIDYIRAWQKQ